MINANNSTHNGGTAIGENIDSLLTLDLFEFRQRIPTNISDGQTRDTDFAYSLRNLIHLNNTQDRNWNLTIDNELRYSNSSFKYFDNGPISGTQREFYNVQDTTYTGVRNFIKSRSINNNTYLKIENETLFKAKVGLQYFHHRIFQEPDTFRVNNLLLDGQITFRFFPITASYTLGLWDDAGSYNFKVHSKLLNLKPIVLKAGLRLYNNSPPWLDRRLYINQDQVFNNELEKINGQEISMISIFSPLHLKVEIKLNRFNNGIYYTGLYHPVQTTESVQAIQAILSNDIRLGPIHLQHKIYLQQFSNNIYNLPPLYIDADYHIEKYIFKNRMQTRFGINSRIIAPYYPSIYSPLNAVFQVQDQDKLSWTSIVDFYTSFKIQRFRSFIKLENLNHLFFKDVHFLVLRHPQNDFKIRFGVAWQIKD